MKILFDGWNVFFDNKEGIIILIITIWGLGGWGVNKLFRQHNFPFIQEIFLSFNLGTLLLTWLCLFVVLLGQISSQLLFIGSMIIPALGMLYFALSVWKNRGNQISASNLFMASILFGCLFILLLLRLAFGARLILPPYDDSPEHYGMILSLLDPKKTGATSFYSIGNITQHYYHFGFHAIAAWITTISRSNVARVMIWLGQFLIVYSVLSIFLLTYAITDGLSGAFVAALFAGLAWNMPAFAANWGKYPAITGLVFLPGWIGLFVLHRRLAPARVANSFLLIAIVVGLVLIHTRLLICISLIIFVCFLVNKLTKPSNPSYWRSMLIFSAAVVALIAFRNPIAIYYSSGDFVPLGLTILLLPFAVIAYPQITLAVSFVLLGVFAASNSSVFFDGYGANWLDVPFVALLLYVPVSLLAGIGFSGFLQKFSFLGAIPKRLMILVPILAALIGFSTGNSLTPDSCCNYVTMADISAISWVNEHTSTNAVIWIAGYRPRNYSLGTDGGVWLSTLTGRNVNKLRYDFDWDAKFRPRELCREGYSDAFVYKGNTPYSFDEAALNSLSWLKQVYRKDSVIIYSFSCK